MFSGMGLADCLVCLNLPVSLLTVWGQMGGGLDGLVNGVRGGEDK